MALLRTSEEVREFLDETGGPVVPKKRKIDRVPGDVSIVSSTRNGRREIVLVVDPGSPAAVPDSPHRR